VVLLPRDCTKCKTAKPAAGFSWGGYARWPRLDSWCNRCKGKHSAKYWLKQRYGVSNEDHARMAIEQGGGCAICGKPAKRKRLHTDHDHATGFIRGLLCFSCNVAVGYMKDSPERLRKAADYLDRAAERQSRGVS
jgi:hypothetical protein